METIEYIVRSNGTLTERRVQERELDVGPAVMQSLTEQLTRTQRNAFSAAGWGSVHANLGVADTIWTAAIRQIPLHARFRLVGEVLVPVFVSAHDVELPIVWQAQSTVRLAFAVRTEWTGDAVRVCGNWLFAFDASGRGFRLPLPNLHDDCLVCTGDFPDEYQSAQEAVIASLEQFRKSKWNADLMRTVERSQKFFRFKPTNETFETLPIDCADWTSLCDKVATQISERVVL